MKWGSVRSMHKRAGSVSGLASVRYSHRAGALLLLMGMVLTGAACGSLGPTSAPSGPYPTVQSPSDSPAQRPESTPQPPGEGLDDSAGRAPEQPTTTRSFSSSEDHLPTTPPVVMEAFLSAARALHPLPVYVPARLPEGAELAGRWRPITEILDGTQADDGPTPNASAAPAMTNPHLLLAGSEPQAELIVEVAGGGLVFLENFRGDLGDMVGTPVGTVAGHLATTYDIGAGLLAQWSDTGRWYALYGWGAAASQVGAVLRDMYVAAPL